MAAMKMVRVYFKEDDKNIAKLLNHLHNGANIKGATLFRGLSGYGDSGEMHDASIVDLPSHLPIVVEFFDSVEKIDTILPTLKTFVKPGHIVSWSVQS